jgi:formylglycine-generating enzyme required for sulfatase activity
VWIERAGAPRERFGSGELKPGHVVLAVEAPAHAAVRLPVLLARGVTTNVDIALPASIPAGMIYVPRGTFLFGGTEITDLRRGFLNAAPAHAVETGAYLIGQHEVTFAEWIAFLDDLAPAERKLRTPNVPASPTGSSLELVELSPKRWQLRMTRAENTYAAAAGERFRYQGRTRHADQDWLRFPVSAISFDDAVAYTAWLARTGRVPNARLCDETEWERAARGADGRTFPHGETLAPDDANFDATYGRIALAYGPDEVGSHPASRSPVGADDMAGNVWEWTRSVEDPGAPLARGGSWYNASISARTANREPSEPTQRDVDTGFRICATPTATPNAMNR